MPGGRQAIFGLRQGIVMPGLVPGIHVASLAHCARVCSRTIHVDGRDKPGHDGSFIMAIARKDL